MACEYACSKLIKSTKTIECPICSNECNEVSMTTCNHTFCHTCIEAWYKVNQTCPMCRVDQLIGCNNTRPISERTHRTNVNQYHTIGLRSNLMGKRVNFSTRTVNHVYRYNFTMDKYNLI